MTSSAMLPKYGASITELSICSGKIILQNEQNMKAVGFVWKTRIHNQERGNFTIYMQSTKSSNLISLLNETEY